MYDEKQSFQLALSKYLRTKVWNKMLLDNAYIFFEEKEWKTKNILEKARDLGYFL